MESDTVSKMIGVLIFQPTNVSSRSRIVTLDNYSVPPCAWLLNQLVVRIERRNKATCRCARVVVMVKHNFMEWGHNKDLTIVVPRLENREGWSLYLKYKTSAPANSNSSSKANRARELFWGQIRQKRSRWPRKTPHSTQTYRQHRLQEDI